MAGSPIDGDDVVGVSRKGALEESIIWFVPDDAQFGEGIADTAAFDDFSNERWIVAEHISVFLENCRNSPKPRSIWIGQAQKRARRCCSAQEK